MYRYPNQYGSGMGTGGMMFSIILIVFALVVMWRIFTKAGYAGWKCLIPIYNIYCEFQMAWGKGWVFLLLLIPVVNIVIYIMLMVKLAHAFGKSTEFAVGLIFLSVIFLAILAFDDNTRYIGPDGMKV